MLQDPDTHLTESPRLAGLSLLKVVRRSVKLGLSLLNVVRRSVKLGLSLFSLIELKFYGTVNLLGSCRGVSLPNHTFSWAGSVLLAVNQYLSEGSEDQ